MSVIKSKLAHSRLIFVDNKLASICLLTQQRLLTVSVHNTQVIHLIWRDQHLLMTKVQCDGAHVLHHFARNFAKCSPTFKILSPAD